MKSEKPTIVEELQKRGILVSYEKNILVLTKSDEESTIIGVASGGFEEALAKLVRNLADNKQTIFIQEGLSIL